MKGAEESERDGQSVNFDETARSDYGGGGVNPGRTTTEREKVKSSPLAEASS